MMKFAVSNIAWLPEHDYDVAKYLRGTQFSGIEIAPSRYFTNVEAASNNDFHWLRNHWNQLGFEITSIQSLLFNRLDLQLFGDLETRNRLMSFLVDLGGKAEILGAGPMVFGSPKNRNRGTNSMEAASKIAFEFFTQLGLIWKSTASYLVLEANPEIYDCNFITKASDALALVSKVNSRQFRWHLDLACTEISGESSISTLKNSAILPSHIHISEPYLGPLKKENTLLYANFIATLAERNYEGVVTLEMKNTESLKDLFNSIEILSGILS